MINGFKINKYWSLTFCMLFFSINSVFSQELPDAEIGLNVIELTASLKERGLSDDAINQEIIFTRQQLTERYLEIRKMQGLEPLLQNTVEVQENHQTSSSINSNSEISDQEIGFDATRETILLKDRSITNPEEINRELDRVREMTKMQYSQMKEAEQEFLLRIQPKGLLRATMAGDVSQSEKEALKALYDSTNGFSWKNKMGWDFSTPVTSWNATSKTGWFGIIVQDGKVIDLSMPSNNLSGSIPSEIGQLRYLKKLDFSTGQINGSIPTEIGQLVNLEILWLHSNALSGTIPEEIGQLINVQNLTLSTNNLTGSLPQGFYNLKKLIYVWIENTKISGEISSEIGKLTNLVNVYFKQNQFSGSIPPGIGQLSKLNFIDLKSNQLTGSIPKEIGQLQSLNSLYLTDNKLSGTIPPEIGLLKNVKWMFLDNNQLSGTVPVEIEKISPNSISVNNNLLEGTLPNLRLSQLLDIRSNKFRFNDFSGQFTAYKTKMTYNFTFSPQAKTDTAKTITSSIGGSVTLTMFEDGRFMPDDTYQWYKNGVVINGATNRIYIITDLKTTDTGTYTCKSYHTSNPDMSPLVLEREPITLNLVNCSPVAGTIKSTTEKFYTNQESAFVFETTATDLTYNWSVATVTGESINIPSPNTKELFSYKFTAEGDYIVTVIGTDTAGCSTAFTKPVKVVDKYCANEAIKFTFETSTANLNYTWTAANAANLVVNTVTNTTGLYTFTPLLAGEYAINLSTDGVQNCETLFSKKITVEPCLPYISCTKTNLLTPEIHRLFIALANKLLSTPNGSDVNVYARKEIAALSPYTTNSNTKIYNFVNTSTELSFSFSETSIGNDVQLPKTPGKSITAIDLSNYEDILKKITVLTKFSDGSGNSNGYVRNINFCVTQLSCESHVALVVDESGSISLTEANKIKKQLKAFVLQQAQTNDNTGSNIYVSLTGMSDSDENTRPDFIKPTKLTNTPASLNEFNTWIDAIGNRNGKATGISASSDYWRSGLEGSLSYSMKPNIVLMITDGCQTADVSGLKATMKRFNNAPGSNAEFPHLYVVGIENGFYVDENFYTNIVSDPNNPAILSNTLTTHLVKSLKYLFDFPEKQFPKEDSNEFDTATFFGHTDFNLLASDETYFSDKLITSHIICGTPSIKDFCDDCLSFKPEPGKEYVLSAWVKEDLNIQVKTFENAAIKIVFYNHKDALDIKSQIIDSISVTASGNIIDGWQRIVKKIKIPVNTITIGIKLENKSPSIPVYFDDIRIHPLQGSVKSFVYDPETFKLMSELDENNYGTFYEYDNEGGLVRVKKETEKGIKTIQETRSGSVINTNQ